MSTPKPSVPDVPPTSARITPRWSPAESLAPIGCANLSDGIGRSRSCFVGVLPDTLSHSIWMG